MAEVCHSTTVARMANQSVRHVEKPRVPLPARIRKREMWYVPRTPE